MRNKIQQLMFGVVLAAETSDPEGVNNKFFRGLGKLFGAGEKSLGATTKIGDLIVTVLEILLLVSASVAVVFLVVGGYQYVVSRGNEEAMEKAKKTISSAVIGIIVVVMSFVIIRIVTAILLQAPDAGGPNLGL